MDTISHIACDLLVQNSQNAPVSLAVTHIVSAEVLPKLFLVIKTYIPHIKFGVPHIHEIGTANLG